jgi:hypothetical protein
MALVAVALACGSGGCGKSGDTGPQKDTENLTAIRKAYLEATKRLGHRPKNLEELKPSLAAEGNPDELLVSPNDNLPYVIVFGADPRKHVIAYEQKGVNGVRMVVDQNMLPKRLSEEDFETLSFPPGHKKVSAPK